MTHFLKRLFLAVIIFSCVGTHSINAGGELLEPGLQLLAAGVGVVGGLVATEFAVSAYLCKKSKAEGSDFVAGGLTSVAVLATIVAVPSLYYGFHSGSFPRELLLASIRSNKK